MKTGSKLLSYGASTFYTFGRLDGRFRARKVRVTACERYTMSSSYIMPLNSMSEIKTGAVSCIASLADSDIAPQHA